MLAVCAGCPAALLLPSDLTGHRHQLSPGSHAGRCCWHPSPPLSISTQVGTGMSSHERRTLCNGMPHQPGGMGCSMTPVSIHPPCSLCTLALACRGMLRGPTGTWWPHQPRASSSWRLTAWAHCCTCRVWPPRVCRASPWHSRRSSAWRMIPRWAGTDMAPHPERKTAGVNWAAYR